jgi:hypothetical protein
VGRSEPLGETKSGFDASSGECKDVWVGKAILRRPVPAWKAGRKLIPARNRAPLPNLKARMAQGAYHQKRKGNSKGVLATLHESQK